MSKVSYFRMSVVCLLILLGGATYGAMGQPVFGAVPLCDNKCRSRYVFTACQPSGGFDYYDFTDNDTTCFWCSRFSQYQCKPQLSDDPNKTCKPTSIDIEMNYYSHGSTLCPCAVSPPLVQFVEGISANTLINSTMITQWTCQ